MLLAESFSLIFILIFVGLGFLSNFFLHRMATEPLMRHHEADHPGSFISERAYDNLKALNDLGPKVVGSIANEIRATQFVLDYANEIKANALRPDDVMVDHQIVSDVVRGNAMYYNIQNVVVRLQGESDHAVLMNSHYDSVPGSPGGSDDVVMICVMLEILRVLSLRPQRLRHSIIFLFNGAEEQDLQAAHGFITKHRWANDSRALINLESTGSGGREILFRSGPKHDWLIHMYRMSAPRPFGHAVADEMFASGVIPSATDFEIFRDYGGVPGVDFAYVEDGWRYHTRYDNVDYITHESVQYTGNNILPLTIRVASSDELINPPEGSWPIYFDYLGLFMISYTHNVGTILNITVAVLVVLLTFLIQTKFRFRDVGFVIFETIISFLTIFLGVLLSAGLCIGMASIMNSVDNTMTWHNTIVLSVGIYLSLALLAQIGTYHAIQAISKLLFRTKKYKEMSDRRKVKISLNGVNLFWAVFTIFVTAAGFRFGYISMILLLVAFCTYVITFGFCRLFSMCLPPQAWIFFHLAGHSVVFLFNCYMMIQVLLLFIPITAKAYYENPETMIALICVLWSLLCFSYFMPLTRLVPTRGVFYSVLSTFFIVSIILAFTSIGFPYSDDQVAPRLQRFRAIHAKRTLHDPNGNVLFTDGNVIFHAWDRNAIRTLENVFGRERIVNWNNTAPTCDQFNCGFTHYGLFRGVILSNFNDTHTMQPTEFNLIRVERPSANPSRVEIEFTLALRTLTHFSVTPTDGMRFIAKESTVIANHVVQNGRSHHIARIAFGRQLNERIPLKIVLEGTPSSSNVVATINVNMIDSTFDQSPQAESFRNVMNQFPDYTFTYVQQADCSMYQIAVN